MRIPKKVTPLVHCFDIRKLSVRGIAMDYYSGSFCKCNCLIFSLNSDFATSC